MGTAFEPSLSTSGLRPTFFTEAPSMADSLPSINFGFEDLRDRMARFTDRFDNFIAKGRRRVLEERNQFRINVAELQEEQRAKKRDIEILGQKSSSHAQTVSKEAAEKEEMNAAIASITQQKDARAQHRDRIRSEIVATQKQISQKVAAQQLHAKALDAQAKFNGPELEFWETYLCMRIEGTGVADRLRFVFTHVDERDWDREACFELDTAGRDYRVVLVKPKIESEVLEKCVTKLNENRELGLFLKCMREAFVVGIK